MGNGGISPTGSASTPCETGLQLRITIAMAPGCGGILAAPSTPGCGAPRTTEYQHIIAEDVQQVDQTYDSIQGRWHDWMPYEAADSRKH